MKKIIATSILLASAMGLASPLESTLVPFSAVERNTVLKNDSFVDGGGQAYLQMGFIKGEKAGVWVRVPQGSGKFVVDHFRVLIGGNRGDRVQVFFQMATASQYSPSIPAQIENAAQITAGPYWNDIPAQGLHGGLPCVEGGDLIGASLEFTHDGAPSVYRDVNGIGSVQGNTLYAIPGGWNYSAAYGLTGDWILRVVGHPAEPGEC